MITGYFAVPGRNQRSHVHVFDGRKPLCGARLSPRSEVQWCANGIQDQYIECDRCKGIVDGLRRAVAKR